MAISANLGFLFTDRPLIEAVRAAKPIGNSNACGANAANMMAVRISGKIHPKIF